MAHPLALLLVVYMLHVESRLFQVSAQRGDREVPQVDREFQGEPLLPPVAEAPAPGVREGEDEVASGLEYVVDALEDPPGVMHMFNHLPGEDRIEGAGPGAGPHVLGGGLHPAGSVGVYPEGGPAPLPAPVEERSIAGA